MASSAYFYNKLDNHIIWNIVFNGTWHKQKRSGQQISYFWLFLILLQINLIFLTVSNTFTNKSHIMQNKLGYSCKNIVMVFFLFAVIVFNYSQFFNINFDYYFCLWHAYIMWTIKHQEDKIYRLIIAKRYILDVSKAFLCWQILYQPHTRFLTFVY